MLQYETPVYRPPSEAQSLILQATIGCSWNHCTYCAMYRHKQYRARPLDELKAEIDQVTLASQQAQAPLPKRVFLADGDALALPTAHLAALLSYMREQWGKLARISCYATARNLLEKTTDELHSLRELGLSLLYIGPESGDDVTLRAIAKGANFAEHEEAARRAHAADIAQSLMFLLGAGGAERSLVHAQQSGHLTTAMNPRYVSLLTVTVVPDTPLATLQRKGKWQLPKVPHLLEEIRAFLMHARPENAVFRSNHASNYLPLSGRIPRDTPLLLETLDAALQGEIELRPEWMRGL